jgi:hypothetical protein
MYEDNVACVTEMHMGYVKSNIIKHFATKFFYPHKLQKSLELNILQTKSCENLADLFTKSLLASSFHRCDYGKGMRQLKKVAGSRGGRLSETIVQNCGRELKI